MTIATSVCDTYTKEVLEGVHVVADTYKVALIKPASAGAFGAATTNYSELGTDEVSGTGYTVGGNVLASVATALAAGVASLDFADSIWSTSTFDAAGFLIYNSSKGNKAVLALKL